VSELHPMRAGLFRTVAGLVGAFVVAVCTETMLTLFYTGLWLLAARPNRSADVLGGTSFIAMSAMYVSARIALPAVIFVALPYVVVSNHFGKSSRRYYLWSWLAIGLLVITIAGIWHFRYPGPPTQLSGENIFFAVSAMITGSAAALAFWLIARPDQLRKISPRSV
jgi:hypothetical protein